MRYLSRSSFNEIQEENIRPSFAVHGSVSILGGQHPLPANQPPVVRVTAKMTVRA